MSILDVGKILMYEFWYDYINPKHGDRAKLCYTDTDSFIIYIKSEDFFEDISNDVEKWFQTSNYNENDKRPLPVGMNKKVPDLFKNELGGKIITEVVALRLKTYAYLMDDGSDHKKAKGTERCLIKTVYRSKERFKSYYHHVYRKEVNTIALSRNDDKRLQTSDRITTYPYGASEMIMINN